MILGVDVGGTFTDLVLLNQSGEMRIHKLLSTAHKPTLAVLQGIADLGAGPETKVVHGSTVGTNALLERRGARTALITTSGFGDILEIGRQTRQELYSLYPARPEPLVPGRWRYELPERITSRGSVLAPLDLDAADIVAQQLHAEGIESVAVCFLFSFLNPSHERQVRDRILALDRDPCPSVSLSSEVLPVYREYERMSTTVMNAYIAPVMERYLSELEEGLAGRHLRIMQSNGGSISARTARALAARTALSGPAAGVLGAFELARRAGCEQIITLDMGGTSADVSLCPGQVQETSEGSIAGLPMHLPMIDIHTVGAGGGSIARLDEGGALLVGPESAGAEPGPVCYGQAGAQEITVTDANLCLGRLDPDRFLGGQMRLDLNRAESQMQDFARQMSLPLRAAAWGIIRVANSNMERAIRAVSVERGHDPRNFTLLAYGGAGPLHACELAEALQIPHVLIPAQPGVLSAWGMTMADIVKDYAQTIMLPAASADPARLQKVFEPLTRRARAELEVEGWGEDELELAPALDMRYVGQSYELTIPFSLQHTSHSEDVPSRHVERFHAEHRRRFSHASESEPVEIVTIRLRAIGAAARPKFARRPAGSLDPSPARIGYKQVNFADFGSPTTARPFPSALYERKQLTPGNMVLGPAVIFQLDATTTIPPGWAATVDGWGNLLLERRGL
jgi:N-methylhydantoinase A